MAILSGLAAAAALALTIPSTPDGVLSLDPISPPAGLAIESSHDVQDEDLDGVPDQRDHCPRSTPGFPVTTSGCEVDEDADGVADGADRCPGTRPRARGARGVDEPVKPDGCSVRDERQDRTLHFTIGIG